MKSSIAESVTESNDPYSLHGAGVSVCSNELKGIAFASLRNFTRGSIPREGTMHCNDKFE